MIGKPTITEAAAERMADRMIHNRLAHDPSYRFAENPHEQQSAEDQIEESVWAEIERAYEIKS